MEAKKTKKVSPLAHVHPPPLLSPSGASPLLHALGVHEKSGERPVDLFCEGHANGVHKGLGHPRAHKEVAHHVAALLRVVARLAEHQKLADELVGVCYSRLH